MSYCVNCGVELAKGEPTCPLCHTPVLNPQEPYDPMAQRPYPAMLDHVLRQADRRFFLLVAALVFLIPVFICLVCDVLLNQAVTWSAYVMGAMALAYVYFFIPIAFYRWKMWKFLLLDWVATLPFLYLVAKLTLGNWFLPVALPITTVVFVLALLIYLLSRKMKYGIWVKVSMVLFAAGLFVVITDFLISTYQHTPFLSWSVYSLIPCVILGVCALLIERRKKWKTEVKKRFFI